MYGVTPTVLQLHRSRMQWLFHDWLPYNSSAGLDSLSKNRVHSGIVIAVRYREGSSTRPDARSTNAPYENAVLLGIQSYRSRPSPNFPPPAALYPHECTELYPPAEAFVGFSNQLLGTSREHPYPTHPR